MDITQLSVIELKALVYDELAKLEVAQQNIRLLQQEIAKKSQPEQKEGQ